jgi:Permeases of the major facilitator superfamily
MAITAAPDTGLAAMPESYPPRSAVRLDVVRLGGAALFHLDHHLCVRAVFRHPCGRRSRRRPILWGFATAAAGFLIAVASPVLGAIADAGGRRKPWIAAFGAMLVIGSAAMWIGKPGDAT